MAFKKMAKRMMESPEFKRMMGSSGAAKEKESGSPTAGDAKAAQMIAEKMSGPTRGRRPMKSARKGFKAMIASTDSGPGGIKGMKKGGMADKEGRAMKRKTADTKGRAMKKGK